MNTAVASHRPRSRISFWAALLLASVVLALLPCVLLPDLSGPMATAHGSSTLGSLFRVLAAPPEAVRVHLLGQLPTFIVVDSERPPQVWWLRPPVFARMALRHCLVAVPFWFALILAASVLVRVARPRSPVPVSGAA